MTSSAAVWVLAVVVIAVSARPEGDTFADAGRKALKMCNEEIKAPESAIDDILLFRDFEDSKEVKCLIKCALEAFGVMTPDGKVDIEKSFGYVSHAYPNIQHHDTVKHVFQECATKAETIDDKCDYAFHVINCFIEEAKKESLPIIDG